MSRSNGDVRRRVLVVDTNEGRREARGRRFEHAAFEVVYARHASEGFRLARRWQPDVVLLHAGLRGVTASDLARRIATDPRTRQAAVVLTSDAGVVGAYRVHEEPAIKDIMLAPCRDDLLNQLVGGAEGAAS